MRDGLSREGRIDQQFDLSEFIGPNGELNFDLQAETGELYRALLADIRAIAEAARQMLPTVEPPDEVWDHIELAIKEDENSKVV